MNPIIDQFFSTFFTQIGLSPTFSTDNKNGCGFTLKPNPAIGEGYLWTYPVNPFCSITIYNLKYYKDIDYCYHHPSMLTLSCSSPFIAKAVSANSNNNSEQLLGYFLPAGEHSYTISKNIPINSVSITMLPEFYNKRLTDIYERDFSDLPDIISLLDGTIEIPDISLAFHQISSYKPTMGISELYYEAKILEIITSLLEWHNLIYKNKSIKSIASSDLEAMHRLVHFLQQHYCDNIDVQSLAKMCLMSKSKLSSLFRSVYGTTIIEFVQTLRIEHAKELLANSTYRIGEISSMVGYEQQSSFSGLFKEKTGVTPNVYRKFKVNKK